MQLVGSWLITRYDDVETMALSPKVFSSHGLEKENIVTDPGFIEWAGVAVF